MDPELIVMSQNFINSHLQLETLRKNRVAKVKDIFKYDKKRISY